MYRLSRKIKWEGTETTQKIDQWEFDLFVYREKFVRKSISENLAR